MFTSLSMEIRGRGLHFFIRLSTARIWILLLGLVVLGNFEAQANCLQLFEIDPYQSSLYDRIMESVRSKTSGERFEGRIARFLWKHFERPITEFREFILRGNKTLGEVDIGIDDLAFIELTLVRSGKRDQVKKYINLRDRGHPYLKDREIIVVAPNYRRPAELEALGATVIRDDQGWELLRYLQRLDHNQMENPN